MADINKSRGLDEEVTEYTPIRASEVMTGDAGDFKITITADVSDTITGLKAVQREAKATTKALRELEAQSQKVSFEDDSVINAIQRSYEVVPDVIDISTKETEASYYDLSSVPTAELSRELMKRKGVYGREAIGPLRWDLHSGKKASFIVIEDSE